MRGRRWRFPAFSTTTAPDFLDAAERAIALNPRNANTAAWIGTLLAHMGEHDRGIEIVDRAIALNPYHHSLVTSRTSSRTTTEATLPRRCTRRAR
jgi:tetratricopeptide (TPR) repeat protein